MIPPPSWSCRRQLVRRVLRVNHASRQTGALRIQLGGGMIPLSVVGPEGQSSYNNEVNSPPASRQVLG